MRFLIKAAFWLSVVIILLPSASPERTQSTPQIGTTEAVTAAVRGDVRHAAILRASAGRVHGRVAGDHPFRSQGARPAPRCSTNSSTSRFGEHAGGDKPAALTAGRPSQHTLTPADLTPAWRGPTPRKESEARRAT